MRRSYRAFNIRERATPRHDTTRHDATRHDTTRHDTIRHGCTHVRLTNQCQVVSIPFQVTSQVRMYVCVCLCPRLCPSRSRKHSFSLRNKAFSSQCCGSQRASPVGLTRCALHIARSAHAVSLRLRLTHRPQRLSTVSHESKMREISGNFARQRSPMGKASRAVALVVHCVSICVYLPCGQ